MFKQWMAVLAILVFLAVPQIVGAGIQKQLTIDTGTAGFYAITNSTVKTASNQQEDVTLTVQVHRNQLSEDQQPLPAIYTVLGPDQAYEFDVFLGYLCKGDRVTVLTETPSGKSVTFDMFDCRITKQTAIPVSVLHEDAKKATRIPNSGSWELSSDASRDSLSITHLKHPEICQVRDKAIELILYYPKSVLTRDLIYRVPQSGTYALHDAWIEPVGKRGIKVEMYIDKNHLPIRTWQINERTNIDMDLGYLAQSSKIRFAFYASDHAASRVLLDAKISQWAVRRAPLRVSREADGYLDAFEPEAPRQRIDIPKDNWVTVEPVKGDATQAIRNAIALAISKQQGDDYVGIRLAEDQTYTVASNQIGGRLFEIKDTHRFVFDGNSATLKINSPEIQRKDINLFCVDGSRKVVLADLIVTGDKLPYATGQILDVDPPDSHTQTVTFKLDPDSAHPIQDIARKGKANGYCYSPDTPGRLQEGSWSFYPGYGNENLKATHQHDVFKHTVTRTYATIKVGSKWLIKNKRAGTLYLVTRGGSQDVTMWKFDCKASGGGLLRNWATDAINILDTSLRPDKGQWISTTSDGIHGRGREGVWVEGLEIVGICEDIMNTYARTMAVKADDNPDDNLISLYLNERHPKNRRKRKLRTLSNGDRPHVGDKLMFFNPGNGQVIGYAMVQKVDGSQFTLSNPVPGIDAWETDSEPRATMVYNMQAAARFVVKDSFFANSMRYGIYIKAPHCMIFNNEFVGLSSPPIYAANEPEWPEGPASSHLWIQGNQFDLNNYSYMSRHRAFLNVDPACISIYTRRFRNPDDPNDFSAYTTHNQFANSNVKIIGNTFRGIRGIGISVRNARNVQITDNQFSGYTEDPVMRKTLAKDPLLTQNGKGAYVGIMLNSVNGAVVKDNPYNLKPGLIQMLSQGQDVTHVISDIDSCSIQDAKQ